MVRINDFDMPKNCRECDFRDPEWDRCIFCAGVINRGDLSKLEERPEWCDLKEDIPPIIKLKIDNARDRDNMVMSLANARYKVWVEKVKTDYYSYEYDYYVCFELENNNYNNKDQEDLPPVNPQEPKYCDRNICLKNEYNGIGCDECEVTKSQESKMGHWVPIYQGDEIINYRCSECELGHTNGSTNLYGWNYCRRCGAKMVEPQEDGEV